MLASLAIVAREEPLCHTAPDGYARPCRIYAPVGRHEDLLPYLVRRLLENGANSSFVAQVGDKSVPLETLLAQPLDRKDLLLGKYIGLLLSLAAATVVGFLPAAFVVARYAGPTSLLGYTLFPALAILLIGAGAVLSALSYVEGSRIMQDVGMASIRLFGTGIAIFLGVGLIHGEVERRHCGLPVPRLANRLPDDLIARRHGAIGLDRGLDPVALSLEGVGGQGDLAPGVVPVEAHAAVQMLRRRHHPVAALTGPVAGNRDLAVRR